MYAKSTIEKQKLSLHFWFTSIKPKWYNQKEATKNGSKKNRQKSN